MTLGPSFYVPGVSPSMPGHHSAAPASDQDGQGEGERSSWRSLTCALQLPPAPAAGSGTLERRSVSRTPRPYLDASLQAFFFFSLEAFLPPARWAPRGVCILPLPCSPRPRVSGVQGRGNVCPGHCASSRCQRCWVTAGLFGSSSFPPLPITSGCAQHRGQPGCGLLRSGQRRGRCPGSRRSDSVGF